MYYTSTVIDVLVTQFGEFIEFKYDEINNTVVKYVEGQFRTSYPIQGGLEAAKDKVSKLVEAF